MNVPNEKPLNCVNRRPLRRTRARSLVSGNYRIKKVESMRSSFGEQHRTQRIGWLRAAVLGANDGILSTASLVLGVAAAHANHRSVLVAGVAALVAGAMSMAAGEYVSVHSQADTEQADLKLERAELKADDKGEHRELQAIYVERGLEPSLAKQVAEQLMAHDALGRARPRRTRHLRDSSCASYSGGIGVGWQLRHRSSPATLSYCCGVGNGVDPPCFRDFTAVPRASRRVGCTRGRSQSDDGRNSRHLLGCAGHGDHRRSRLAVRDSCVSADNREQERFWPVFNLGHQSSACRR